MLDLCPRFVEKSERSEMKWNITVSLCVETYSMELLRVPRCIVECSKEKTSRGRNHLHSGSDAGHHRCQSSIVNRIKFRYRCNLHVSLE